MASPKLVSAIDESGAVVCVYDRDAKADSWKAVTPKKTTRGYAKAVLDVFLPAGYPHTVTPDYTPYQIYLINPTVSVPHPYPGLGPSRGKRTVTLTPSTHPGFGVGDSSSSATGAVLLTVLQESTGRLATILFAHRFGQAIEPECKRYRFLADLLNDSALLLDVLSPLLPGWPRVLALCGAGVLRALCGVSAGAAKASLSAHFARNGNLAELNAKDGSQETVISLLGMLAGSLFVRAVSGNAAVWAWMAVLVAAHLVTNYAAVRAVRMRSLNRQRAQLVLTHYVHTGRVLDPAQAAARERILTWRNPGVFFASSFPCSNEITAEDLRRHRDDLYVVTTQKRQQWYNAASRKWEHTVKLFMKEGATPRDTLEAWFKGLRLCGIDGRSQERGEKTILATVKKGEKGEELLSEEFWRALASAGWDLDAGALETGSAVRIRVG
ncbi:hypothetical protein DL766_003083 [Monosporascus sp. MC13-8B]|uniref:Protein root UVB sensitive/RUS domain-containing protein n=1 Tax=Monosporascus cannonballus TaxID=155416 RepID=A0ABY0GR99_9PEZI|nr:hypothetical protein DL762_010156 [Monosporascus cannonballus]RYO76651.1 hypothetical protein DL763_010276 [Monosporascus cannonballus]RYP34266.1 hypothetical protein DL766_003083 [Monosporascus sp. MC13-8B]